MKRMIYLILGFVLTGLGIIGAFLPLMPTTIFLILAAACFARSSPRFEAWLMNHPRFGPSLRSWRDHGVVPPVAKVMACLGMTFGFVVFFLLAHPKLWLALLVGGLLGLCALFVISRPSAPRIR